MNAAFEVVRPDGPGVPVVAHVPHAATMIPADVRAELTIGDDELAAELMRLTDWHTDDLFGHLVGHGVTLFLNRLSRLVFDPERFLDDAREPAAARGQGVVYTHGTQGQRLREDSPTRRAARVDELYRPYHAALGATVGAQLANFGRCTVIDCHSFPSVALPSELDQAPDRPDICIGTDPTHTPPELAEVMQQAFRAQGFRVARDTPFAGTFVPSGYYESEPRVTSVMIEVRRGLYVDERTGTPTDALCRGQGSASSGRSTSRVCYGRKGAGD